MCLSFNELETTVASLYHVGPHKDYGSTLNKKKTAEPLRGLRSQFILVHFHL